MLERIRRCNYCNSDMTDAVSSLSYSQNPFCDECYDDRVAAASASAGPRIRKRVGRYFESVIPSSGTPETSGGALDSA